MAKIKVTQVKSRIGSNKRQRATLDSLGLRRINHTIECEGTPQIMGMVEKVRHLVRIEQQ
jgi:large subunit ribosomal protein L30